MEINDLALDLERVRDGAWFDHPLGQGEGRVRLRPLGCRAAIEWMEENAPRLGTFENGKKVDERWLDRECLARVYLTGWEGWTEGGDPVPFGHDKASGWVHDERLEHWTNVTLRLCERIETYRERQVDEAGKP